MSVSYEASDRFPTGILHINLYSGREISRPADLLVRRADPYVVVTYNGWEAPRSKVCSDQGSNPEWNQHFYFPIREGDIATVDKSSSGSENRTRLSKLMFSSRNFSEKTILEPDTLEIKVFDKNSFRHDYDIGSVRIPSLPRVITSTPHWYLEKQAFPVVAEVKGEPVSAGELWMEIGFELVDESEFEMGWISEPSLDGRMHQFKSLPATSENSLAHVEEEIQYNGEDEKRRIKELTRENLRLSQKVAALQSQLNVSDEDSATLEMKLNEAEVQISDLSAQNKALSAQNKALDDRVAKLEREISKLSSSGFWQTLCCCLGSSRHPQDKREETAPLLGTTPNKPAPSKPTAAASNPGPAAGTSKQLL